jgi:hypothetical protein
MRIPIFKSRDADNIRVYADEVRPGVWAFTRVAGGVDASAYELSDEDAQRELARCRAADALSFYNYYFGTGN